MMDIEILTDILKELGFLDDSELDKNKVHAKDKPNTKYEDEEHDTQEGELT